MLPSLRFALVIIFFCVSGSLAAQRNYAAHSVLASGNWFQVAIPRTGIYKMDAAFLRQAGISLPIPSAQLRLYGKTGSLPGEACHSPYSDDLHEIAIEVLDGGDGNFDNGDRVYFYAAGAHGWEADAGRQTFRAIHNLYADTAYIYITTGGEGKRVREQEPHPAASHEISSYQYRFHFEEDLYNLLSSGKEWVGQRFLAGNGTTVRIDLQLQAPVQGVAARLVSAVAARSVNQPAAFSISLNSTSLATQTIASVSSSNLDLFSREDRLETTFSPAEGSTFSYNFSSANQSAIGWLNYLEVFAECRLQLPTNGQLDFRTWQQAGQGKTGRYRLENAGQQTRVWRVTDAASPVRMVLQHSGQQLSFTDRHEWAEEYIAFDDAPLPVAVGAVPNQDLHGVSFPQMVIVADPALISAAQRLADWHLGQDAITSLVVTPAQLYHEFSGGQPNPTAIRDFLKMLYDRAGQDPGRRPRYLLLFGDASYDYKYRTAANNNAVPTWQSSFSFDPLSTYATDDYYGFLDDAEDINSGLVLNQLDIGIGRIPVSAPAAANDYIDKVIHYHSPAARGVWRNELTFIADDEDQNLHLQDAEVFSSQSTEANHRFRQQKIYLDAFPQQSDAAGSRYPAANQSIYERMQTGTLIWNYSGHGGYRRLAEEVILDEQIADTWQQNGRLPLFITATCDFAPYDNPAIQSLGEYLLLKRGGGAIALMTTTRLVFAFSNRIMNANYLSAALRKLPDGRYRSLGEAVQAAKNATYLSSGDVFNNRKFTLLGDPALTLAFPRYEVATTRVNGQDPGSAPVPVRALEKLTIEGQITDAGGQPKTDFNGVVYADVLDQVYEAVTRANDAGSLPATFKVQDRALFRGKATVKNGVFQFSFIIPGDINYASGALRISYYAMDSTTDAHGAFDGLAVSGSLPPPADREGPRINAWLNDSSFLNGGIVSATPELLLRLADTSGINVLGSGIGHDIMVMIDGNPDRQYVLNRFFEADTDTYRSGTLRYRLPELGEGPHVLRIKAWDVVNNSSEVEIHCRVKDGLALIKAIAAWPNPSNERVKFVVDHNSDIGPAEATIQVFAMNGSLLKTLRGTIIASSNRSYMDWNGKDDRGNPLPPGVYIYRIQLRSSKGGESLRVGRLIRF